MPHGDQLDDDTLPSEAECLGGPYDGDIWEVHSTLVQVTLSDSLLHAMFGQYRHVGYYELCQEGHYHWREGGLGTGDQSN